MPLLKKIDVRNLRAWARSLASIQHYLGATGDDPHKVALLPIPSQQSCPSASRAATEESRTTNEPTLATPFMEEATTSSDRKNATNTLENNNSQNPRPAWIKGVYLCANATVGLLLVNILFISVAGGLASKHPWFGRFSNSKVIYDGNCTTVSRWNTALHLIINVLSTCILAASNYCMQTLVAPSRDEVDIFHAKRRWLDIGGASFRNLFAIPYGRLGLWVILLITATPFHLLYNSIVFQSLGFNYAWTLIGPHDFNTQNVRNLTTPALEKCFHTSAGRQSLNWDQQITQITESKSKRISTQECYGYIAGTTQNVGHKGFVLLASNLTMSHGGNISMLESSEWTPDSRSLAGWPFVNLSHPTIPSRECYKVSDYSTLHISECLAFEGKGNCQLLFSPLIGVVLTLATLAKVIAIFFAARLQRSRAPPLLTTGDAIASFLERSDETTKGMCWASLGSIKKGSWMLFPVMAEGSQSSIIYERLSPPMQWRKASSPFRWLITMLFFCGGIAVGLVWFGLGCVPTFKTYSASQVFAQFWDSEAGGGLSGKTFYGSVSELQGVIITNCAQLVITLGYYFYNSVLTNMLSAAEYSSYGVDRKPLRVTWPVEDSQQRSTYWLSIPYRYGIPMMLLFMTVHWLVSLGFYYDLMMPYDLEGHLVYEERISRPDFSIVPMLFAALLGFLMGILLIGLSFRRLESTIPLAGPCSAAISAACHLPSDVCKATAAHGKVMWGETSLLTGWVHDQIDVNDPQKGHCSFTPLDARQPSLDKLYA